ncbi:hypothetical protein KSP40_PGU006061 [Platanthera guangdongensis]|uniref:Reverse transcriptase Ty1/copia-type domain-containing protein n=1 Tax=Platanthera guangdongensis TaxID=2320717 RepID=A0ABR2LKJ8_9ASPA
MVVLLVRRPLLLPPTPLPLVLTSTRFAFSSSIFMACSAARRPRFPPLPPSLIKVSPDSPLARDGSSILVSLITSPLFARLSTCLLLTRSTLLWTMGQMSLRGLSLVPKPYWNFALSTACFIINRLPSSVLPNATPFSLLFPSTPAFPLTSRIFGCTCYVHHLGPYTDKLDPCAAKYVFVDYSRTQKGYVCYSPTTRKVTVSADVTFREYLLFFSALDLAPLLEPVVRPVISVPRSPPSPLPAQPPVLPQPPVIRVYSRRSPRTVAPLQSSSTSDAPQPVAPAPASTAHPMANYVSLHRLSPPLLHFATSLSSVFVPKSVQEALQHPGWRAAMDEEMTVIWANQTWVLVPLPPGQQPVGWDHAVKQHLSTVFQTKDLGHLRYFLGLEVARRPDVLVLSQRKYCLDLLKDVGQSGCKPDTTLMDANHKLRAHASDDDLPLQNLEYYRRLVGKLIYLTVTRPDISFAIGIVSRFMHAPRVSHLQAVERILRYLKAAPGEGLVYKPSNSTRALVAFFDADYASSLDDRRSTSGFCTYFGGHLITWKSKKQVVVARSSAEAEYRSMTSVVSELTWLESLLADLGVKLPSSAVLFCDIQMKKLELKHVPSTDQVADILTKALSSTLFYQCLSKLGAYDLYAPACGGIMVGCCTVDILKQLSSEEISRNPVDASGDRIGRLAMHLLSQHSFYPLYPPSVNVPLDFSLAPEAMDIPLTPDVLLLPSDLAPFIKVRTLNFDVFSNVKRQGQRRKAQGAACEISGDVVGASVLAELAAAGSGIALLEVVIATDEFFLQRGLRKVRNLLAHPMERRTLHIVSDQGNLLVGEGGLKG